MVADAAVRRHRASQLAAASLRPIALFDVAGIGGEAKLAAILAHCLLRDRAPGLLLAGQPLSVPMGIADRALSPAAAAGRRGSAEAARLHTPLLPLAAPTLSRPQRRALWESAIPDLAPHAAELAARFPVTAEPCGQVRRDLRLVLGADGCPSLDDAAAALKARGASRSPTSPGWSRRFAGWDDLVLPASGSRCCARRWRGCACSCG